MSFIQIAILAIVQGAAELLPVSSSAHVIVAEKLLGLNPTAPQMTLLLVQQLLQSLLNQLLEANSLPGEGNHCLLEAVFEAGYRFLGQ